MLHFKNKKDQELFCLLHPALIMIYADLVLYTKKQFNVDLVITQTVTTKEIDERLNRVSASHRECRALDIRTKNLDIFIVNHIVDYINKKPAYHKYHYTSFSGTKRLAYYHHSSHEHIHLAIASSFAKPEAEAEKLLLAQSLP